MAHYEQQEFIKKVKDNFGEFFKNVKVLDVGSYDINGEQRHLFENCDYTGIDLEMGPGVDIVASGNEYSAPDEHYDTIISCECFEHNPFYDETILNCIRMLKPGGLFLFTCATTGREVHGIKKQEEENSKKYDNWKIMPSIKQIGWDENYYKNVTEEDVRKVINIEKIFENFKFEINYIHHDLYFYGIKKV